ncbi:MAG: nucleotide sugar dehydrogenase [Elusimicrobia bacterium]|nr:nucleotide sugar dehydrogenase [Elusimicrobiota bacterium]
MTEQGRPRGAGLLLRSLKDKTARIGVIGAGYVGLPLAMEFCRKGFKVCAFDINKGRVADLMAGRSYVLDVSSDEIKRHLDDKLFEASAGFEGLSGQDVLFICVQTPLRKSKEPDIGNILSAVSKIVEHPRKGQLVILESTTFPGTTDEIVLPRLEKMGKLGRDFYLAFSPERVDPGNHAYGISNTPKVVGGVCPASAKLALEVYGQIVETVVPVSDTRAAETVKLLENSFRAVNIALVNEMAQVCHRLGLDVWEVIGAAATKPFGFMPFYPGPGIGGHCIPKDPQLLSWKMKTLNYVPRFIELATTINQAMPEYVVGRIADVLNEGKKALHGSRILVLGVAYKPGISDYRESPSLDVMDLLLRRKAVVSYHDPFVPAVEVAGRRMASVPLSDGGLRRADCVAVLTAHQEVDYGRVVRLAKRVFDARNATKASNPDGRVHRL